MSTEIQQLLLEALENLTKEYQKQGSEQIERESLLMSVLERLQSNQSEKERNLYSSLQTLEQRVNGLESLEAQLSLLTEQNRQLNEQLEQLAILFKG